ncbi:MAG: MBL fold metallo-hydrolase [Candidatus Aenigmarchaeota archaeon]|nr:MBL fold metallo-hydrolase [Candidatus Aenigmarchaeota archaeon]
MMLDYGVKVQELPIEYPKIPKERIDGVLLSHAHLDHSGAIPVLFKRGKPAFFATEPTISLSSMLIEDSIKIAKKNKERIPFSKVDLKKAIRNSITKNYNERFRLNHTYIEFFDAGHIPGSSSIMIDGKKRIMYTGDIKLNPTHLLAGCLPPKNVDILITESTYAGQRHPKREKEEERFRKKIDESLSQNRLTLVPSFAVGRAQEILLILEDYASSLYIDGMAKKATEIISYYRNYIRDNKKLKHIMKKINWIGTNQERDKIIRKGGIVITTAGMLGGGPIVYFIRQVYNDPSVKILMTGFQVEDTPGYQLLKTGTFRINGENKKVNCEIEKFDFSAHADDAELQQIIKYVNPEKVICVHGDNCAGFAKELRKKFDIETFAPKINDILNF